jgi:hypothetical protein
MTCELCDEIWQFMVEIFKLMEVNHNVSSKALKILHNSSEFMPYVIFIAAPGMEQLKHLYGISRSVGSSNRNLTVST